VLFITVFFLEI